MSFATMFWKKMPTNIMANPPVPAMASNGGGRNMRVVVMNARVGTSHRNIMMSCFSTVLSSSFFYFFEDLWGWFFCLGRFRGLCFLCWLLRGFFHFYY